MQVRLQQAPHAVEVEALELLAEGRQVVPVEARGELGQDRVGPADALAGAGALARAERRRRLAEEPEEAIVQQHEELAGGGRRHLDGAVELSTDGGHELPPLEVAPMAVTPA